MDPGVVRVVAVVALIFFIAGDLGTIFNPLFKSLGAVSSENAKKTHPVRTDGRTADLSPDDDEDNRVSSGR